MGKASRIPSEKDRLRKHFLNLKELEALIRLRDTARPVLPTKFSGGSPAGNTAGTAGNFLPTEGGSMIGNIAFDPKLISVIDGRVNLDPAGNPPENSTYIFVAGEGSPDDIRFIDGAERSGQYLIYQGTNTQVQNILNANLLNITNIVGDGVTTVTVTLSDTGTLADGSSINLIGTNNFDINGGIVANLVSNSSFTYQRTAGASTTPESTGVIQDGNIITADGNTLVLDGTLSTLNVPIVTLIFDLTAFGGAWRVVSVSSSAGGGLGVTFPILYPKVDLTPSIGFNQTIDLSATTGNAKQIQFPAGDIGLQIIGDPSSVKGEDVYVLFIQDSVGGRSLSVVDSTIKNGGLMDGLLDKGADAKTLFRLATLDGGVSYHAILVDLSTAAGSQLLSNLTIDVNKDWNGKSINNLAGLDLFANSVANNILNMGILSFVSDAAATRGEFGRSDFFPGSADGLVTNIPNTQNITWTVDTVEKFRLDGPNDKLISSVDLDMSTFNIVEIDQARFVADSVLSAANTESIILLNTGNQFQFNTAIANDFVFSFDNNAALILDDTTGTSNQRILTLQSDSDTAASFPVFKISRTSTATVSGQDIGEFTFEAQDSADLGVVQYSAIRSRIEDNTTTQVDGSLSLNVTINDSPKTFLSLNFANDGEVKVGADLDMSTFDIVDIDRAKFVQDSGVVSTATDTTILLNNLVSPIKDQFQFNTAETNDIVFSLENISALIIDRFTTSVDETLVTIQSDSTNASSTVALNLSRAFDNPLTSGIGSINFNAGTTTSVDAVVEYASITSEIEDATTGSVDGSLTFNVTLANGITPFMTMNDAISGQVDILRDLDMNTNNILMGTGGDITGGGASVGMTNIGHLDFVDNLATPVAPLSIFSDGTDLFANTGGGTINFSDIGEFFGPWTANHDAGDKFLQNLAGIGFNVVTHQINDQSNFINYVASEATGFHRFTAEATNILDIDDTGLTMLSGNIALANNNVTGVNQIEFNETNQTITDDVNGMRFSLPDTLDTYNFTIESNLTLSIEKFFLNLFNTRIQMTSAVVPGSAPTDQLFFYAKDVSGVAKLFYKDDAGLETGPLAAAGASSFPIRPPVTTGLPTTGLVTLNLNQTTGHYFNIGPLTGNINITISNPPAGDIAQAFRINIVQGSTGRTVTFNDTLFASVTVDTTANSTTLLAGDIYNGTVFNIFVMGSSGGGAGTGDVIGPSSATDNAIARFDTTTGKLIQNSGILINDSNSMSGVASILFAAIGGQISVADGVGGFNFVHTSATRPFRFTPNGTNVLDIDTNGLTMLSGNIALGNSNVTGVNQIAFNQANQTITDDINGMRFSLPDDQDTYDFSIGTGVGPTGANIAVSIEKFFINFFNSRIQMKSEITPANPIDNNLFFYAKDVGGVAKLFYIDENGLETGPLAAAGAGSGDVVGPASATDNAIVRFDSTSGKLIQNSLVTIDDTTGNINIPDDGEITGGLSPANQFIKAFGTTAGSDGDASWEVRIGKGKVSPALAPGDFRITDTSSTGINFRVKAGVGANPSLTEIQSLDVGNTSSFTGTATFGTAVFNVITSKAADVANSGFIRMGTQEFIAWESSPPGIDLSITALDANNNFQWSGSWNNIDFNSNPLINAVLGASLNASSNKITSLATPTVDADAATKKYVDDNIGISNEISQGNSSVIVTDTGIGSISLTIDATEFLSLGGGSVVVSGTTNFAVGGFTDLQGNVDLGNATTDTISFEGRVDTDFDPNGNATRNMGAAGLRWNDIFADRIVFDSGTFMSMAANSITLQGDAFEKIVIDGAGILLETSSTVNDIVLQSSDDIVLRVTGDGDLIQFDDNGGTGGGRIHYNQTNDDFSPFNNIANLGQAGRRWVEVFALNGVINTSFSEFKKDIQIQKDADCMNICDQLEVIKFRWKDGTFDDMKEVKRQKAIDQVHFGYKADALKILLPEAVTGNSGEEGVYEQAVIGVLIGAIKHLNARIAVLEAQ